VAGMALQIMMGGGPRVPFLHLLLPLFELQPPGRLETKPMAIGWQVSTKTPTAVPHKDVVLVRCGSAPGGNKYAWGTPAGRPPHRPNLNTEAKAFPGGSA
jgi:hypothetical protein